MAGQNGYPRSERIKTLKCEELTIHRIVRMDTRVQSGLRLTLSKVTTFLILQVRMDTRVQSGLRRLTSASNSSSDRTCQNGYARSEYLFVFFRYLMKQ